MNDFEIQINAIQHANFFMLQELVRAVAKLQGSDAGEWISKFEASTLNEIDAAQNQDGSARDAKLIDVTKSVVKAVSQMAASRL